MAFMATLVTFSHTSQASLALEKWDMQTRLDLPLHLKVWLASMFVTHLISIFFIKKYIGARWVLGSFIGSHIVVFGVEHSANTILYGGMVSLSHIVFWIPALIAIYQYRSEIQSSWVYKGWVSTLLCFYSISLVFDVRDAIIWGIHSAV